MKYKYMLFGSFLTLIIVFILSIIMININDNEIISIGQVDNYKEKINILKDDIDEIKEDKCKKSLNNMLARIEETNFKEEVTIKKYYQSYFKDDKSFSDLYSDILKQCALEENDDLSRDIINQSIYPDEIKNRYLLRYELSLRDYNSRELLFKTSSEKATFITKTLELNILRDLIEEVENEEDL